jgi:polysaccharide pyruvyl transferase WcaK-like protein
MFSQTIKKLKKLGYEVKLFTNGAISDQKFIEQLKEYMKLGKSFDKMVEPRPEKAKDLINLISSYDVVLGTRLHSNIISYSLEIPTVSIVWNNKQLMFSKINGIEDYFITKENFNADYVVDKILTAHKQKKINKKEYKQTVYNFLNTAITNIIGK